MENTGATPAAPARQRRYMKNYLIDRRFQLGWVARVSIVVSIIVAVMGYFLYGTLAESIEMVNVQALTSPEMTPAGQEEIIKRGQRDKLFTGLVLGVSLVGLVLVLSLMTIVVTHKVAGPVYKMKRLLHSVDGSHLQLWEKLRKGDELHDVFEEFSMMLRRMREARHLDIERLEALLKNLEAAGVAPEVYASLRDIIAQYNASVKMD